MPGYGCQVHHAETDWAKGGLTNITDEALACGPHNRLVTEGGWRTRNAKTAAPNGSPPRLDWGHLPLAGDGQPRVTDYHHPNNYLVDNNDDED